MRQCYDGFAVMQFFTGKITDVITNFASRYTLQNGIFIDGHADGAARGFLKGHYMGYPVEHAAAFGGFAVGSRFS